MENKMLKHRLRARRRAMKNSSTWQPDETTPLTELDTVSLTSDHEDVTLAESTDIESLKEDENVLRVSLASRHERTKRRLEKAEQERVNLLDSAPNEHKLISSWTRRRSRSRSRSQSCSPSCSLSRSRSASPFQRTGSPYTDTDSYQCLSLGSSVTHSALRGRLQDKLLAVKRPWRSRLETMVDRFDKSSRFVEKVILDKDGKDVEYDKDVQERVSRSASKYEIPSEAECYDFFTKEFEDIEAVVEKQTDHPVVLSRDTPDSNLKKLVSEIIPMQLDWKSYDLSPVFYPGYHVQVYRENTNYFYPSMLPVAFTRKGQSDVFPRYLKDEGFYVGERPRVLRRNKNIVENRLLHYCDQGFEWFGPDGEVKALPNPVQKYSTKPWISWCTEINYSLKTVYVRAFLPDIEIRNLELSQNELLIDIGTVVFLHHPLMSKEHVLASNLNQLYEEYMQRRRINYVTFFIDKLAALRNTMATLKETVQFISDEDEMAVLEGRMNEFLAEIRRTSQQLNEAESIERDLIRKIIEEWKEIKQLRKTQGYSNTTVQLTVNREGVDFRKDLQRWEDEVEHEVLERQEEHDIIFTYPHQEKLRVYKEQLQEWKQNRRKISRLRNQSKKSLSKTSGDSVEESDDEVIIAGDIDKPLKPDKPAEFDGEAVQFEVMKSLLQNRRNPGEGHLSLQLTNTHGVTSSDHVPICELARRRAVHKASIYLKLFFNGMEITHTGLANLTMDFKVRFGSVFRARISQWPESLKVQFIDPGLMWNTVSSESYLTIPEILVHTGNVRLGVVPFTSHRLMRCEHEGVGSNTPFRLRPKDLCPTMLCTRGLLVCSVSWGLNKDGTVLAPRGLSDTSFDPLGAVYPLDEVEQPNDVDDVDNQDILCMTNWIKHSRLDPNNPANLDLIPYMGSQQEGYLYALDYFRIEQLQEEFDFITTEDLEERKRFRVLHYRDREIVEFRHLTMVPCREHEILESAFTAYETRRRTRDKLQIDGEKRVQSGILSAHRLEILRFRQRVRDAIIQLFFSARHRYTLHDMVVESQVPDVGTLTATIIGLFARRRPLKPIRKERHRATGHVLTEGSVKLCVNVVRGYNLPIRETNHTIRCKHGVYNYNDTTSNQTSSTFASDYQHNYPIPSLAQSATETLVCPFVVVSFQGTIAMSSVAYGPNPTWNEELHLPFSAPNNDYSASNLQSVNDILYIYLFDRTVEDATQWFGQRDSTLITHRILNHWLGSYQLPFSAIYQRGKIEGAFRIKIPAFLLGYNVDRQYMTPEELRNHMEGRFLHFSRGTYLNLFITIDPILIPTVLPMRKFESRETELMLGRCVTFKNRCNALYPQRNVKTTVIDIHGESVFISRYITPLQPPVELTDEFLPESLATAQRVARFVSLIPTISDKVVYSGVCDFWCTCDQFLNMLIGNDEEHAVLLVNYFLYLGKRAFLLLGNAVPEGDTAYVLTIEDDGGYFVWNARTGQYYDHYNSLCPLKSVGAIVNNHNIWFNIQPQDEPSKINYDLSKLHEWKPFYSHLFQQKVPFRSAQPPSLYYVITDRKFVAHLTDVIESTLKDRIFTWRRRSITRWNRTCNAVLYQVLKTLEQNLFNGPGGETPHRELLIRELGGIQFTGFPMDFAFTDVESILSAVRATEVYRIDDPDVEFALAVYIHPYAGSVLAVWIYLAALVNVRRNELLRQQDWF